MKITQNFAVARPIDEVWAFFHDVPRVAACLPGAQYLSTDAEGKHLGKMSAKIGPFQASFEGEAAVVYDEGGKAVDMEGKGVDRKGASRGKMTMECRLAPDGDSTLVAVVADVQLSGAIAQFGRTGIITEIANVLVADFARNAEAEMLAGAVAESGATEGAAAALSEATPTPRPAAKPISGFSLLLASLRSWFGKLLGSRS